MRTRWTVAAIVALALVVTTGGCGWSDDGWPVLVPAGQSQIADLAWLPDGTLHLLTYYGSDGQMEHLVVDPGGRPRTVAPPVVPHCGDPEAQDLSVLPDGRLGIFLHCRGGGAPTFVAVGPTGAETVATLVGTISRIVWEPGLRSGWIEYTESRCGSVGRFADGDVQPFPAYRPAGLLAWPVDRDLNRYGGCDEPGRAAFLDLSRSGEVFFLASRRAEDVRGYLDEDVAWSAFVLDRTGNLRRLAGGFEMPRDLAVTPDGHHVLVGTVRGLWRIDVASGGKSRIAEGGFRTISPAPDGHDLATVSSTSDGDEVVRLPLDPE